MTLLLQLLAIYRLQLPNMVPAYMMRLLYDRVHCSLVAVSAGNEVICGTTFRVFPPPAAFVEVAFCAVRCGMEARGYGSAVLAHLKEYARHRDIVHLLTMADNNAIVFFRKQGFSTDLTLRERQWKGYVKEYEGVTLMECLLHRQVDYRDGGKAVLARQRAALQARVDALRQDAVPREGLDLWKNGPGYVDPNTIPGLAGLQWLADPQSAHRLLPYERWQPAMVSILDALRRHPAAGPLCRHVDPNRQFDLPTITDKCTARRFYVTPEIFAADLRRLFTADPE